MGGGTYEETLFGILGLHGSAVGFLYGLLFRAQKDGPSMPSSSQTVQSGSGSGAEEPVEIKTYPLPEENVQADRIYAPSPSTGGFWTFAVFNASSIQAYDPVTRTSYIPCYQAGCKHQ